MIIVCKSILKVERLSLVQENQRAERMLELQVIIL